MARRSAGSSCSRLWSIHSLLARSLVTFPNTGPGHLTLLLVAFSASTAASERGLRHMAEKTVWFITGAGRGMGVDIAEAALAAGHSVVSTGRNTEAVADAVGEADDVLVAKLDITSLVSAEEIGRASCRERV